jgi:hypothetical protein
MRSLINLLLSNLIPIVIAVSIFIRIYVSIKNAIASNKKRQSQQAEQDDDDKEEELDVWKRLQPDDEEETIPVQPGVFARPLLMPAAPGGASLEVLGGASPEVPGTRFIPSTLPPVSAAPLSALPLESAFEPDIPSLAPAAPLFKPSAPSHELPQDNFRAAAFFRNVNRLPPLQQAVIFAEILGTPKGME